MKTKHRDEDGFMIKKFSFNLEILKCNFNFKNGTEICIHKFKMQNFAINTNNKFGRLLSLKWIIGARYRNILLKKGYYNKFNSK